MGIENKDTAAQTEQFNPMPQNLTNGISHTYDFQILPSPLFRNPNSDPQPLGSLAPTFHASCLREIF